MDAFSIRDAGTGGMQATNAPRLGHGMLRGLAKLQNPRCRVRLLYSLRMRWWRHSPLVKALVMVLLLWTAADLSNASLCALDNESNGAMPMSVDTTLMDGSSGHVPRQAPLPHIDDCFCCSHCLDLHVLALSTRATPAHREQSPLVLAAPRIFASPIYHPPLA